MAKKEEKGPDHSGLISAIEMAKANSGSGIEMTKTATLVNTLADAVVVLLNERDSIG